MTKLWYDDVRNPPDDTWIWARTNKECIEALKKIAEDYITRGQFEEMSLDHDMGLHLVDPDNEDPDKDIMDDYDPTWVYEDGMEVVEWMCQHKVFAKKMTIHSWNPPGAERMAALLRQHGNTVIIQPYKLP